MQDVGTCMGRFDCSGRRPEWNSGMLRPRSVFCDDLYLLFEHQLCAVSPALKNFIDFVPSLLVLAPIKVKDDYQSEEGHGLLSTFSVYVATSYNLNRNPRKRR